jgi:hypothetical protein
MNFKRVYYIRYLCSEAFATIVLIREFFRINRIGFFIFDVSDQASVVHHQENVCESIKRFPDDGPH